MYAAEQTVIMLFSKLFDISKENAYEAVKINE
jgi:hypothetical protein